MKYFVENTLENLTLIRTVSDSFPNTETDMLFRMCTHHSTILLTIEEGLTPQFGFRYIAQESYLSEAELRELVFTLSLEQ